MPVAEVYCNPSLITGGDGSSGNPYGDMQFALDSFVHNGSGMRLNVLAGTTEYLTGALNPLTYLVNNGQPAETEPLIIQGYSVTPGDRGRATINGISGVTPIWGTTTSGAEFDFLVLQDLILYPGLRTDFGINCDNRCVIKDCYYSGVGAGINMDQGTVEGNTIIFYGSGSIGYAVAGAFGSVSVYNNYIRVENNSLVYALEGCNRVINNVIDMRAASPNGAAINVAVAGTTYALVLNNTIISNNSGGGNNWHGIRCYSTESLIENNYIYGFPVGIDINSTSYRSIFNNNKFYNNTINVRDAGINSIFVGGTGSLLSDGVANATGGDFTPGSQLIGSGYPTGFNLTRNYPNVGAIYTQNISGGGTVNVNPLGGFLII